MPYIPSQDRTERVELRAKIRPEVVALVSEYAQVMGMDEWYVIQEALRKLESDKDFQRARKRETAAPEPAKKVKAIA